MAFTVQSYRDLVQLLAEHPEWRAELRRLMLSDEPSALPENAHNSAEVQWYTEQRLKALAARVDELEEAQRRTERRLEELTEAQQWMKLRLDAMTQWLDTLLETQNRIGVPASPDEFHDVILADVVMRGQPPIRFQGENALLVIEASAMMGEEDVGRAGRRVTLLRKAGLEPHRQSIVRDRSYFLWDEVLSAWAG